VRQRFLTYVFPAMLRGIYLGTPGWLRQHPNIVWHGQPRRQVPARAVHQEHDEVLAQFLGEVGSEQGPHRGIRQREHQGRQPASLGTHGGEDRDELPHDLPGHGGPQRLGSPAAPWAVDPATAALSMGHTQHGAGLARVACPEGLGHRAREGFLQAACCSGVLPGCRGRGTTLRPWGRLSTR
jgi:hypothetical protein